MKNIKNYYIYLFISTIMRNIIDVYSVIYLYQMGLLVKDIIFIYMLVYFLGIYLSKLSLTIGNKIGYKYILMISSIVTSFSFYIITYCNNIYFIAIFLSLSIFTYHPIKHYYGILFLKEKKSVGNMLILIYMATFLSSFIAITNFRLVYLVVISVIGIIPALFLRKEESKKISFKRIPKNKFNYFVFDQFKIIFVLLESLYLYLISNNLSYVGMFNIILTISSIIFIYFLVNKINIYRYYKFFNIIFTFILILKINVVDENILLIIAFLEGMGIKMNELVSTINLYDYNGSNIGYLISCEKIFCIVRTIILFIIFILPINLKIVLYILILGIFVLSFQYKKDTT